MDFSLSITTLVIILSPGFYFDKGSAEMLSYRVKTYDLECYGPGAGAAP